MTRQYKANAAQWRDDFPDYQIPGHWPKHVRPLSLDDDQLGIGDDGKLYWDGAPVKTDVGLTRLQNAAAALVTVAAIASALAAGVSACADWATYQSAMQQKPAPRVQHQPSKPAA